VEIDDDAMYVQAITRTGRTVDAAVLEKKAPRLSVRDMAAPR
jgi:hypothetical protein